MKSLFSDRRANIFMIFAAMSVVLLIPCPDKFRNVGEILAATYFVLGIASWADARGRTRGRSNGRKRA